MTVGFIALGSWVAITGLGNSGAQQALETFESLQAAKSVALKFPDQQLWSSERVRAWHEAHRRGVSPPLAILRIPRITLEVAVLEGTDEWTLNTGVGYIEDTARPGAEGNVGLAGHRDGFFRGLKDVRIGDVLEVETLDRIDVYQVERTWVVEPEDVSVLNPTAARSVTLVTCYPFYFVGAAPQRFIVRGVWTHAEPARVAGG